ncbi:hypothetical protein [Desulfosarcina cetonica]|uniref:hypothetical protein n=1 Tax=Desulfosarcina cetonica TaxID=90730 RepID=UPI0012EDF47B|nr:hypothetical protein [Desulfosarcina cetonica]
MPLWSIDGEPYFMDNQLTKADLEARWKTALMATRAATTHHPRTYRTLKDLASRIVSDPVDIDDYFPTVENLLDLLSRLDPCGRGSIFQIFNDRIKPTAIWQIRMLRLECRDLLSHLDAFEAWRCDQRHLRCIK